jgi:signal transduction histidine kinase
MRNYLSTTLLAFELIKRGTVGVNGSTGAVVTRNLQGLRHMVDTTLDEVRIGASERRREPVRLTSFVEELAVAARLHGDYNHRVFELAPAAADVTMDIDPDLLASAVTNLLNNAFKFTPVGGHVVLRASVEDGKVCIEVEDECGGIPDGARDPFTAFGERRGSDRTGLGLGLSIARRGVRAHGGDIQIRNTPGKGCVFVVRVPLAPAQAHPPRH